MRKRFVIIFFLLNSNILFAQAVIPEKEAWEENIIENKQLEKSLFPVDWFLHRLISFYQQDISTQSISRCPFSISCSQYLKIAIEEKGFLVGILYFLDRNHFRENIETRKHYFIKELSVGVLKLDDSFFLYGAQK